MGRPPVAGGRPGVEAGGTTVLHQTDGWRAGKGCEIQGHAGPGNEGATERIKSACLENPRSLGELMEREELVLGHREEGLVDDGGGRALMILSRDLPAGISSGTGLFLN